MCCQIVSFGERYHLHKKSHHLESKRFDSAQLQKTRHLLLVPNGAVYYPSATFSTSPLQRLLFDVAGDERGDLCAR